MYLENDMTNQSDSGADIGRRQELSALVDGELGADGVQRVCAGWRSESALRETWHTYSLIGDVMRSEDLAAAASRDEAFLRDFRQRLSAEPVVLAPQAVDSMPAAAIGRSARVWRTPAAVAAGLMVAVGAMVITQVPRQVAVESVPMAAVPASTSEFGSSVSAPQVAVLNSQPESSPVGTELVFDGQVIRDPRLDRYLLAHKQFSGSSVLGAPSGFLRNAAAEVPAR